MAGALRPESLYFNGYGYHDVDGEWHSDGNIYAYLSRGKDGLRHNYQVDIYRGLKKGTRIVCVWLCITGCNSREELIFESMTRTLKAAKEAAVKEVLAYDSGEKPDQYIQAWLPEHASPVFVLADGEPVLAGTTYRSLYRDIEAARIPSAKDCWLYYNDDVPDYGRHSHFYSISRWPGGKLGVSDVADHGGYIVSGGVRDADLLRKMLDVVRNNPRYQRLFHD